MSRFFLFLICFFGFTLSNNLFSQDQEPYYPRILIVSPTVFEYDPVFESEMVKIQGYVRNYSLSKEEDLEKHPPNIRKTMESVSDFTKNSSAKGLSTMFITERMLFTMFRGKRNFVLVMDTCKVVETGDALKLLAEKYDVQHIVYFPKLKLTKSGELGTVELSLKVYDAHSNSLSMTTREETNWDFDEEDENPELAREKTAVALIHNVSYPLWFRILTNIYDTNESYKVIKDQMGLSRENGEEEYEVFYEENDEEKYIKDDISKCLKKVKAISPDLKSLNQILQTRINPFSTTSVFQVLFNKDKSKFIAFCLDSVQSPNALSGYINKNDDVEYYCSKFGFISASKTTKGTTFYGSLIRGIKENDHWFFDQVTYSKFSNRSKEDCQTILLSNLYYWGYLDTGYENLFEDNDGLFGSPSRFDDKPFPYEGLQFWDDENKEYKLPDYMSFVEVNDRIREMGTFENLFKDQRLKPFYKQYFDTIPDEKALLLYSPDRKKIIHPYFDSNRNKTRYFLFVENTIFEWNYFTETQLNKLYLKDEIVSKFNKITTFDYGDYLVLGDEQFWNTTVFSEDASSSKFLSEISK